MSTHAFTKRALLLALAIVPLLTSPARADEHTPTPELNAKAGLAVKGYDPVAYFTRHKAVKGDPAYSYAWSGVTWRFASAEDRDLFIASPARYAPQYGGYCAFAISRDLIADISPKSWAVVDDKLYLNNNPFAQKLWQADRSHNVTVGDRNWAAYPKTPIATAADAAPAKEG